VVIDGFIGPLAVGRDATDIAGLNHDLQKKNHNFGRNGSVIYAISRLDIAGSAMDFHHMFSAGAVTFAQPSVTKIGGVTELRKIMTLADAHDVTVVPHAPYFGPGLLANLHLLAAYPPASLFERLYIDLEAGLFGDATDSRGGEMRVPQGLGLGHDPAVVAGYGAT
jgi:L-alanine-DL-glutamate epimerase-like enolase superfamily enzyme